MSSHKSIEPYSDERGNRILFDGNPIRNIHIEFTGSNNTLTVAASARISAPSVFRFDCNNASISVGAGHFGMSLFARVGEDSKISIGDKVTSTSQVLLCALEGSKLEIGNDVMFSSDCQVRCDDEHPIFDIESEQRVNLAKDIKIGDHVWLGWGSRILGGARIGSGSVVGMETLVKGEFSNNCVIAGSPARVLRKNIAWEREHLSLVKPYNKPDASYVVKTGFWNYTVE